jgi:hypothetical protein
VSAKTSGSSYFETIILHIETSRFTSYRFQPSVHTGEHNDL